MLVIPAVDVLDGKVVRLHQGKREESRVYSDQPLKFVEQWMAQGARFLHLVDLNGAFGQGSRLLDLAKAIADLGLEFQVGGGIRTRETADLYLKAGATRIVMGTAAVTEARVLEDLVFEFGAAKVVVAIDTRGDQVMMKGWTEATEFNPLDYAVVLQSMGLRRVMITDIGRDGTMQGANVELINRVAEGSRLRVLASGGIGSIDDLRALKAAAHAGVEGAVLGRSIYEGRIQLAEAIAAVA
ncbi:MAG: 1-(5-phosphoribosyl)-5-[(5-phosphoribosylamino)methylideneamino]imidazole-4-carboxamide isomerase [Planctomycetes bacterium]|nr:1-(5-phosphoribosyl)-5-[(5-phosphoribosylamino)methylideneamino]imidazole-4-carboxamide isomerase [Planctomycetota bacterium]